MPEHAKPQHASAPRDTFQLVERLRFRLAQLRTIGDPEAAALAAECEAALVEMKNELDAIEAMTTSRPALRF